MGRIMGLRRVFWYRKRESSSLMLCSMPLQSRTRFLAHSSRVLYTKSRGFVHKGFGLADVNKPAGNDIRPGDHLAALGVDGAHRHNQAVLREVLPVPQHNASHIAHAQAVHQHIAGGTSPSCFMWSS